jgi:hypothetical protein
MLVAALSCRKSPCHGVDGWRGLKTSLGIAEKRKCMRILFWYKKLHQWIVGSQHFKAVSALILLILNI